MEQMSNSESEVKVSSFDLLKKIAPPDIEVRERIDMVYESAMVSGYDLFKKEKKDFAQRVKDYFAGVTPRKELSFDTTLSNVKYYDKATNEEEWVKKIVADIETRTGKKVEMVFERKKMSYDEGMNFLRQLVPQNIGVKENKTLMYESEMVDGYKFFRKDKEQFGGYNEPIMTLNLDMDRARYNKEGLENEEWVKKMELDIEEKTGKKVK